MNHLIFFLFGTIIGSFLNVIIYRIPNSLSIVFPGSFCPNCKHKIPFYRNIPLISFIIQYGKCKNCQNKISFSYPMVEFLSGLIFLVGFNHINYPESVFFIIIANLLLCIAVIDYKHFIIPYEISISIFLTLIPFMIINSNLKYNFYGMLIGVGYLLLIFILTWFFTKKQPIGFGDIKLIILLGLWLGPVKIILTIFIAAIIGIIFWFILSLIKGFTKQKKLPFGTFLSLSAIIIYLIKFNWDLFR